MITSVERRVLRLMVFLKLWTVTYQMGLFWFLPKKGTIWMYEYMLRRQSVDDLKHAPCCEANHYHRRRFVLRPCRCGAVAAAKRALFSCDVSEFQESMERARALFDAESEQGRGGEV